MKMTLQLLKSLDEVSRGEKEPHVPAIPGAGNEGAERRSDLVEITGLDRNRNVLIH